MKFPVTINGRDTVAYQEAIGEAVKRTNPKSCLEIGLQGGLSAEAILKNSDCHLLSMDIYEYPGTISRINGDYPGRLRVRYNASAQVLSELIAEGKTFDFIYVDGDHSYKGCYPDIEKAMKLLSPTGVILIDDYGIPSGDYGEETKNGEYGVERAVDELLANENWQRVYEDISFNNGAVAFKRVIKEEPKPTTSNEPTKTDTPAPKSHNER